MKISLIDNHIHGSFGINFNCASYDEIKYYGQGKVLPVVGSKITITISPESAIAIIKKAKEEKNGN